MTVKNFSKYSDLNENPTSDRDVIIKDEKALHQAIDNFIEIVKGERLFNNSGIDPESELFELGTDDEAMDLFNDIVQEINNNEPRIELNMAKSKIAPDYDNNRYVLALYFNIIGSSIPESEYVRRI